MTALDQSERMLARAGERLPTATLVQGDALELPFEDDSFDRVFTGHFYGHLDALERAAFVAEARRAAVELVVVDSSLRPDHGRSEWQRRVLNDASAFDVYKRYFDPDELAAELGGGSAFHSSRCFVGVVSR